MLAMSGWLPVLPVPGSIIPAFPLAWGLGQLLVLVGILGYFFIIITFIPSAFFSPGRRNQPLLLPSPANHQCLFVPPLW